MPPDAPVPADPRLPYRDASLAIETRARDLLARMTREEKLAQIVGVWSTTLRDESGFSAEKARRELAHGIGHVTRIGAATTLRPAESARFANEIQRFLREQTRLAIPAIVHEESCAGYTARDATCFPQALGLAASFEPALVEEMGRVIRAQMRAVGAHHTLAPVLDVARDPRWGRMEESFGEDPYLVAQMGVAYVRGVQGEDLAQGVAATGKHFLGYAASEGGLNWAPAHLGPRELRDVYAFPFEAAIHEAGLASVMNAYHELDGVPCGASRELFEELLRKRLGFTGVVVTDYFTVPPSRAITAWRPTRPRRPASRSRPEWTSSCRSEMPMATRWRKPSGRGASTPRWSIAQCFACCARSSRSASSNVRSSTRGAQRRSSIRRSSGRSHAGWP